MAISTQKVGDFFTGFSLVALPLLIALAIYATKEYGREKEEEDGE